MSVITSIAGLESQVRTLSEGVSDQRAVIRELKEAVMELSKGIRTDSRKKRNNGDGDSAPVASDNQRDPTYVPPLDTNFSVDLTGEHLSRREKGRSHAKSTPCSTPEGMKHFNHLAPKPGESSDNIEDIGNLTTNRIPKRMLLAFAPTSQMDIAGVELVVASYIFSCDVSKSEVLVDTGDIRCDRDVLWSLKPRGEVVDDVSGFWMSIFYTNFDFMFVDVSASRASRAQAFTDIILKTRPDRRTGLTGTRP
ncbi:hypothetical protein PIB30_022537 [Stylosanthes scabra]|uniref:Uncharacterized protein n=1 Tax=Stylosanthes scabra TaxID=79078 RepID=A0ABU6WA71_9FABA|nr:hypothetical protein [Stylosanthes scabra]